jgi:hypothetical protein
VQELLRVKMQVHQVRVQDQPLQVKEKLPEKELVQDRLKEKMQVLQDKELVVPLLDKELLVENASASG